MSADKGTPTQHPADEEHPEREDWGAHTDRPSRETLREATLAGLRWVAASRVAAEVVMFGSIVALAHLIPPAEFGRAAVALILPPLALSVAFQGFGSALVQRESVERGHVETAAFLSIALGAGLALAVYKVAPHLIPLYGYRIAELFQLASPVLLLGGIAAVPHAILQRKLDFRRVSMIEVAGLTVGAATSVTLALLGLDAKALVLGAVAMVATTAVLMCASASVPLPRLRRGYVRAIVGFGTPASLETLFHSGFRNIDYVILGATLGPAQVGFYYRAFQMGVEYQGKVTGIMSRMAFPVYSRTGTMADLRRLRERITRLHAIIVFPLLAGLIALAPVLVPGLFGSRWEPAVEPVQILAVGGAFAALISGTGPLILAIGRPRALVVYNGARIVVYAAAVLWAASYHGLIAVCFAVVAVQFVALAANQYFLLKRIIGIPMRQLWDDAAGAVVACLVLLVVALPLTRLLTEANAPWIITVAAVGTAGMAAYLLTLRVLFAAAWKDLALVGRRMLAKGSSKREPSEPAGAPAVALQTSRCAQDGSAEGAPPERQAVTRTVGHVVPEYLPRSATFIYTVLRFQRQFQPVVFTQRTANLPEFPLAAVREAPTVESAARESRRRAAALGAGYASAYQHWIAREAGREQCVALHAHFGWSGTAAVRAATRLEIPLITTFYGRDISAPERGRHLRHPHRRLFADGTLFVCEGPFMARHLSEHGCPHERIRIVRIGIDLSLWPFRPPKPSRPLIVLQACRFWEKKGVDLSLRAFAAATHRLGPSELWLVGDGPLRAELESLADRLGIASQVRFLGMLSYSEYQDVLNRAHVCLQPSRTARDGDTEGGAPTVLLEMQAMGIPVVSTRHADIPFVVPDPLGLVEEGDVTGIADALIAVAALTESEWRERAKRGRALVEERHEAGSVAREIDAVYEEALLLHHGEQPADVLDPRGTVAVNRAGPAREDVAEPARQSP